MARKQPPFPPEASTKPDHRKPRRSQAPSTRGNAALKKRPASEAPTLPPPPPDADADADDAARSSSRTPKAPKVSAVRPKARTSIPAATVDEVTADMRKDPRRDDDE